MILTNQRVGTPLRKEKPVGIPTGSMSDDSGDYSLTYLYAEMLWVDASKHLASDGCKTDAVGPALFAALTIQWSASVHTSQLIE